MGLIDWRLLLSCRATYWEKELRTELFSSRQAAEARLIYYQFLEDKKILRIYLQKRKNMDSIFFNTVHVWDNNV